MQATYSATLQQQRSSCLLQELATQVTALEGGGPLPSGLTSASTPRRHATPSLVSSWVTMNTDEAIAKQEDIKDVSDGLPGDSLD
jgi:hypothetical protein